VFDFSRSDIRFGSGNARWPLLFLSEARGISSSKIGLMALNSSVRSHKKQLQPTVIPKRWTAQRAAAELRR
jgi:hypothetical protein